MNAAANCWRACFRAQGSAAAVAAIAGAIGEILEAVRKLGLEGVVGKRIDSIYEPGERSGAWIKLRTNMEQEFVIGGYIPGAEGSTRCLWAFTKTKNSSLSRR